MRVTVDIDLPTPPPFYAWSISGVRDLDQVCLWYEGGDKPVIVDKLKLGTGDYWAKALTMLTQAVMVQR